MGDNLNGPTLVRAPDWLPGRLGRYYLYFGHHHGQYIRLAVADELAGPWRMHEPGTLKLDQTPVLHHIASPEVKVKEGRREIWMYFHGRMPEGAERNQQTCLAVSRDGLSFKVVAGPFLTPYLRTFTWRSTVYGLSMPGLLSRSDDGGMSFEEGRLLFSRNQRHVGLRLRGSELDVFYTNAGDCPESIYRAVMDLRPDWTAWQPGEPELVMKPEKDYEGALLPLEPSKRDVVWGLAHQLRDPFIFEEDGRTFLVYAAGGEYGLGLAEIFD